MASDKLVQTVHIKFECNAIGKCSWRRNYRACALFVWYRGYWMNI